MGRSKHSGGNESRPTGAALTSREEIIDRRVRNQEALENTKTGKPSASKSESKAKPKPKPSSYAPREGKKKKSYGKESQPPVINDKKSKQYR